MWAKKPNRSPGRQFKRFNRYPNKQGNTSYLTRLEGNVTYQIRIQNIPKGVTEEEIRNLLVTGKPLTVKYFNRTQLAFVTFKTYKEAELTVKNLDKAPPYNLNVDIYFNERRRKYGKAWEPKKPANEEKFFVYSKNDEDSLDELPFWKNEEKKEEIQNKLASLKKTLGYDPSIRMYQSWLDSRNGLHCVSLGRGYTFMGEEDRFVGGLQAFHTSSENFSLENEVAYPCEYCKSLTVRICGRCEKPYCSLECLRNSRFDHEKDGCNVRTKIGVQLYNFNQSQIIDKSVVKIDPLPLKPNCTVVISTYYTLRTLYVRQTDKTSDEKFCNLCNDVAAAALKEGPVKVPEVGMLCIARYYEDLCFYRAEICSVENEKVNLIFVDFGNCQETDLKDIKKIPSQLKEERKLATKVELIDVPDSSSLEAVNYFNQLTAESTVLIVKSIDSLNRVVLMEKDSNTYVNKEIAELLKPSWIKRPVQDSSINTGKPYYYDKLQIQGLEIGEDYNFVISYVSEADFDKTGIFWVTEDSDSSLHVKYEMKLRMMEFCNFLGNLPYLPRDHELCIAYDRGELHRCVSLKAVDTYCLLLFVDDGQTAWIKTKYIRKMEEDFLEVVSQAISVKLSDDDKWKENKFKILDFLNDSMGQTVECAHVHKAVDDYFIISIPKLDDLLK